MLRAFCYSFWSLTNIILRTFSVFEIYSLEKCVISISRLQLKLIPSSIYDGLNIFRERRHNPVESALCFSVALHAATPLPPLPRSLCVIHSAPSFRDLSS